MDSRVDDEQVSGAGEIGRLDQENRMLEMVNESTQGTLTPSNDLIGIAFGFLIPFL